MEALQRKPRLREDDSADYRLCHKASNLTPNSQFNLGKCVRDVMEASKHISDELAKGKIRTEKPPAPSRRGADMVLESSLEVLRSASQKGGKT